MTTPIKSIDQLTQDIAEIQARNQRVEADKAWETSWTRRGVVVVLTYLVVVTCFTILGLSQPWLNAIIPAVAFLISTSTLSLMKKWWLQHNMKNYLKK